MTLPFRLIVVLTGVFLITITGGAIYKSMAQDLAITPSGLHTQVKLSSTPLAGNVQYDISGGTRPGGGLNLFHSFGEFSVPTNSIASFQNGVSFDLNGAPLTAGLPTENILARVTSPNPSTILGTIQTAEFGDANLFLINPSGIIFGPDASLNIGGSVTLTTADYLRLQETGGSNAGIFYAAMTPASLLTSASVEAFGFLNSNPTALALQGGTLRVDPGKSISLMGGAHKFFYTNPDTGLKQSSASGLTITGGKLLAPGGEVNIVSVASPGEILRPSLTYAPNIDGVQFKSFGGVALTQNGHISVSSDSAGTVKILGGQFVIDQSSISANTIQSPATPVAIDINLTGDLSISTGNHPAINARAKGSGNAGKVHISSDNMIVTTKASESPLAAIDTHSSGVGNSGNVTIRTGALSVTGDPFSVGLFIDSGSTRQGHGGNISITAESVQMQDINLSTGNFVANILGEDSTGSAGNVEISAKSVHLKSSSIDTNGFSLPNKTGEAGDISITAQEIQLETSVVQTQGYVRGGTIAVNAGRVVLSDSRFETQTILTSGGSIDITASTVDLKQGSQLISVTGGNGNAGPINVRAREHVGIWEGSSLVRPSGIFTQSFGRFGSLGNSGNISITAPRLWMTFGGRINTVTRTNGNGGNVTIDVRDAVTISGEFPDEISEPLFNLGPVHQSGIFTSTVGGKCSGQCGEAGHITVTTNSLMMGNGSQIDSGTTSNGQGGNITVTAGNMISASGTLSDGSPVGVFSRSTSQTSGAGAGGNISLTASQSVTIQDGASVATSSTGPGNAGNILINAGQQLEAHDSPAAITTKADKASGGNIDIRAVDSVRFVNSNVSASVSANSGNGGNISIDPNVVVLQNSNILAQAARGQGGNITITTPVFLQDQASRVDASSQFGINGTVTIQSPTSNLSGTVGQLTAKTTPPQVLLQNRCVALAGGSQQSSFLLAGRDSLPVEPGGWLSSPAVTGNGQGEPHEHMTRRAIASDKGLTTITPGGAPHVLSLRRLTPPGFLVRTFFTEPSGCSS